MKLFSSLSHRTWNRTVAVIVILTMGTVMSVGPVWSQDNQPVAAPPASDSEGGNPSSAGMQAAAAVSTILYLPLKAAFAIGGGIVGGLAYIFSGGNEQAAKSIWNTSLYGTYIITPDHLQGNRPIRFLGLADSNDESPSAPAPEPVR